MMRNFIRSCLFTPLLCVLLCAVLLVFGCNKHDSMVMPERPPAPVAATQAISATVPVYLDQIGKTVASEFVSIIPQVTGRITDIKFTDGAELTKGQELFIIDVRPYQAQLNQAVANLDQSKATRTFAAAELQRIKDLFQANAGSKSDLDSKQNALDLAESQIKANEAAEQMAQLNLEYCTIRSPIDGRAGLHMADVGNVVKANEGTLLVVQRLDPIFADFTISERDLDQVRRHMADNTLKVQVRLPDDPATPEEGDLTFLDSAVKDGSGTVKLRATLHNQKRRLWGGQFVNIRLILQNKADTVLVPAVAAQVGQKGPYVYVVGADSIAQIRPITPGQRQGDLMVIESGVKAGEQVITDGQIAVTPGGKVRVQEGAGKS